MVKAILMYVTLVLRFNVDFEIHVRCGHLNGVTTEIQESKGVVSPATMIMVLSVMVVLRQGT